MTETDFADIAVGDYDSLLITVTTAAGAAQNITGFKIVVSIKRNIDDIDTDAVWLGSTATTGVAIVSASGGTARATIPNGSTSEVEEDADLIYCCTVYDASGNRFTQRYGKYPVVKVALVATS